MSAKDKGSWMMWTGLMWYQRYNATNNELLRTQTLVKGAVVDIDATPFRQWYESHVSFVH